MEIWLIDHYAVPPSYYPLVRQTLFAKNLMHLGHSVKIFAASSVHNSDVNLIDGKEQYKELMVDDITYVVIKCKQYSGNGLRRIMNMFEFARKLPKVCAKYKKPDAIVSTSMTPLACAQGLRIAKRYGCKKVAQISDLWPETLVTYGIVRPYNPAVLYLRRLEKWIYTNANDIVFTMEGAYDYIKERKWEKEIPREKTHYINNGIDLEAFEYNREHYQVQDEDLDNPNIFKVVYVGSIRKVNNLGLLLDTAREVKMQNIKFLVWGDGDELDILNQRLAQENILNVQFKGKVDKKYIPNIVSRADLNIAHNTPSSLFRFGISFNKIFDYLAAGKPILSDFPCKYNPAVQVGAGVDLQEPIPELIAQEIERFAIMDRDEYQKYCNAAKQGVLEYTFTKLTQKLISIIENEDIE